MRARVFILILSFTFFASAQFVRASVIDKLATLVFQNRENVRVCFAGNLDWSKAYLEISGGMNAPAVFQRAVSDAVTAAYRFDETGINYIFSSNCGENPDEIDALVVYNPNVFGKTINSRVSQKIGFPTGYSKPYIVMGEFKFKGKMDPAPYYHDIALHEFGHLSGLAHEDFRKEILDDPSCDSLDPRMFGMMKGHAGSLVFPNNKFEFVGSYDSESIMNYCKNISLSDRAGYGRATLSSGDRETLRYIKH